MSPSPTEPDARLQALLERSPVACAFVRDATFETTGDALDQLFAGPGGTGLAATPTRAVALSDAAHAALAQRLEAAFADGHPFDGEVEFVRRDGSRFWGRLRASPVRWQDPQGPALWFVDDVSDVRRQREQPHWQAVHDPVTELANRPAFERRLAHHVGSRRVGPVSALVVDLDAFSAVNDRFGRDGGDQALCTIGALLVAKVRASDLVARLEDDRFGVLLPACDLHHALLLADKLRAEIARQSLRWGYKRLPLTARIGVTQLGTHLTSPQAVIDACLQAAAEAKAAGGDTVRVFEPEAARQPDPGVAA